MAFGDKGRWKIEVEGVPFNIDANSAEEAQAAADSLLARYDSGDRGFLTERATRLGLTARDSHVLSERAQARDQGLSPDSAVVGRTNVDEALEGTRLPSGVPLPSGLDRAWIGLGRSGSSFARGVRQIVGGEETEQREAQQARVEDDIYQQFGQGLGMEDVGEAIPALAIYTGAGIASGGSAWAAAATGAAMGALREQTDPSAEGRAVGAVVEGAMGGIGQKVGNLLFSRTTGSTRSILDRLRSMNPRTSFGATGMRQNLSVFNFFRSADSMKRRAAELATGGAAADATAAVITAAKENFATAQAREAARLGNGVLNALETGIRALPYTERAGALGAAQTGLFQGILKKSIDQTAGTSVVNPTLWRKGMAETVGKLPSLLKNPAHRQLVQDMNSAVGAMESLTARGVTFSAQDVDDVLRALQSLPRTRNAPTLAGLPKMGDAPGIISSLGAKAGPTEAEAIAAALSALRSAESAEAKRTMLQVLIDNGRGLSGAGGDIANQEAEEYVSSGVENFVDRYAR